MASFFSRLLSILRGEANSAGSLPPPNLQAKADQVVSLFKEMGSVLESQPSAPKHMSPSSIESTALALFTLLRSATSGLDDFLHRLEQSYPNIHHKQVQWEMLQLKIFAIDFAAFKVFGPGSSRDALLDRFQYHLSSAFGSIRGFEDSARDRMQGYTMALRTPHSVSPLFNLGRGFSQACGAHPDDLDAIVMASITFAATVRAAELIMR